MEEDIIRNIRLIELLKCDMLKGVAQLFKSLYSGTDKAIEDSLSSVILCCYILGNRVGLSYNRLDQAINEKGREYLKDSEKEEYNSEDVLNYLRYRDSRKA